MTERRYGEEEVREIFSLATTGDRRDGVLPSEPGGLTLDELQRIGQEVGIEPARVAQAAEQLDARGKLAPVRRSFGLPVGVSRVVDLPRAPTDREWERLISEFRTTFGTQGHTTTTGGLREWSQGNLHISIEPTEYGEQLRLSTLKEDGIALNGLGGLMGAMSVLFSAVVTAAGKPDKALLILGLFGGMSLAAFGTNLVRLPRWARERERQMEAIAEHAVKLLSDPGRQE
ncbi:MAG TPA: hypothetical protein VFA43_07790 [Gemmatimonadaceae bacterium]|nr:hypothetical protein [Gemmatimonadaceae bacterium]